MNTTIAQLFTRESDRLDALLDDELPEAPVCWSLDDFADLLGGVR